MVCTRWVYVFTAHENYENYEKKKKKKEKGKREKGKGKNYIDVSFAPSPVVPTRNSPFEKKKEKKRRQRGVLRFDFRRVRVSVEKSKDGRKWSTSF